MTTRLLAFMAVFISSTALFAAESGDAAAAGSVQLTKEQSSFFESKIRPLLAENCYKCHSVEQGKSKGGLTLDTREGWHKGGETGSAIVPGNPDKSLLIKAISYTDHDLQMPPKGKKLGDNEIANLVAWVKMGAPDPRVPAPGSKLTGLNPAARVHRAYQPVKPQAIPPVKNAAWAKAPVDAFVLAKLEQKGMQPSRPASRESLIRREYYDLIGLPPTPQEVQEFVRDTSPNAFEKVVDKLLASPRYGERWGRFWLDTARYSDTTGGENAKREYRYPFAWTYRDYVIKSFNDDKPYDRFVKEQIAADLLPAADKNPDSLAALGFITVGKRFQNPNDQIDERIDALTKSTMALTVACARCHDHKFDPIPTADYYSLHGIFNSIEEPEVTPTVGVHPDPKQFADFQAKLSALERSNRENYFDLLTTTAAAFRKKAGGYMIVATTGRKDSKESLDTRYQAIQDYKLDRDLYQNTIKGRPEDGVFGPMYRFTALSSAEFKDKAKDVLAEVLKGGDKKRPVNPLVLKAFSEVKPESLQTLRDVAAVYQKLFTSVDAQCSAYYRACQTAMTTQVTGFDPALIQLADITGKIVPAPLVTTEYLKGGAYTKNNKRTGRFQLTEINELLLTHPGAPGQAMLVKDSPRVRDSAILVRGEAKNRGPVVPRRFLEIIAGPDRKPFTNGSGRLELVEAIASKDNPLTARVAINRLWMHHFGEGFVRTLDDMGVQSEKPSHPELLDYLAGQFVADGWSFKKMHKRVMLSNTYQQSSDTNASNAAVDPENRLLWRANLRRLDFEAIRDTMLQFAGKLDTSLGGKPVNLTDEPYSYRRSVYGYVDRGTLPELMSQFDFAEPDMTNSKRASTIVPQQALFFMNSPMAVDVVRKATSRPEFASARNDAQRVAAIYAVLLQRAPKENEVQLAGAFVDSARQEAGNPDSTPKLEDSKADKRKMEKLLANTGKKKNGRAAIQNTGTVVERKPLTVWERLAQALLFSNEIVYVN